MPAHVISLSAHYSGSVLGIINKTSLLKSYNKCIDLSSVFDDMIEKFEKGKPTICIGENKGAD